MSLADYWTWIRMRRMPPFGRDRIRRFWHDVASKKKLAARDYEAYLVVSSPHLHKERHGHQLELRLPGLEVVPANEQLLVLSEFDHARDERVLRHTIHEQLALVDCRDGEERRGRPLHVQRLDRGKQVVHGVVHAQDDVAVAL